MLRAVRPDDTLFVFSLDGMRTSHGTCRRSSCSPSSSTGSSSDRGCCATRIYPPGDAPGTRHWCPAAGLRGVMISTGAWSRRTALPGSAVQRLPIYEAARSTAVARRALDACEAHTGRRIGYPDRGRVRRRPRNVS